jgi:hypothetical protein
VSRRKRIPCTRRPKALFVLPAIPDEAPAAVKNALAIRNQCSVEGHCPACDAEPELYLDQHGIHHLVFRHDEDCPCLRDGEAA